MWHRAFTATQLICCAVLIGCEPSDPRPVSGPPQVTPRTDGTARPMPPPPPKVVSLSVEIAGKVPEDEPANVQAGEAIPIKGALKVTDVKDGLPPAVTVKLIKDKVLYSNANANLSEPDADGNITFETDLKGVKAGKYQLQIRWFGETIGEQTVNVAG